MINGYYNKYRNLFSETTDKATFNTKLGGSFDPFYYILKLRDDFYKSSLLNKNGHQSIYDTDSTYPTESDFSSFGTYLHELMHWWQYIGSSKGFICSMTISAQTFFTKDNLSRVSQNSSIIKPIFWQALQGYDRMAETDIPYFNDIINTWFDLEFAFSLMDDPARFAKEVSGERFFLSIGHCMYIQLSSVTTLLDTLLNKSHPLFRNDLWVNEYNNLIESELNNYSERGPHNIFEIGMRDIFESQARFSEVKYLNATLGWDWDDFERKGYLSGTYLKALEHFLTVIGEKRPNSVNSKILDIFPIVCDLSVNSGVGYPYESDPIADLGYMDQPGVRFHLACKAVSSQKETLISILKDYTKEEYFQIASKIAKSCNWREITSVYQAIISKFEAIGNIDFIQQEQRKTLDKSDFAMLGIFIERHLSLIKSKLENPNFFCWPYKFLIRDYDESAIDISTKFSEAFDSSRQLFSYSTKEGGLLYHPPYVHRNIEKKEFGAFYLEAMRYAISSDYVRRLISDFEPVNYNYEWLDPRYEPADFKRLALKKIEFVLNRGIEKIGQY